MIFLSPRLLAIYFNGNVEKFITSNLAGIQLEPKIHLFSENDCSLKSLKMILQLIEKERFLEGR